MIVIALVLCLAGQCETRVVETDFLSPVACMIHGQSVIAQQLRLEPEAVIKRWACVGI